MHVFKGTEMKIAKIETFRVPPRWLFVRVETDDGLIGWGEASLEGHNEAVEGAFASLRDRALGTDATRIEDLWQTIYRLGFYRGGPVLMSALAGLDQALWDIRGKALGVPVWQLLGGAVRDLVPVYAWIGGDRPQDVVDAAKVRQGQGFKAVKMNATEDLGWLDSPRKLDEVLERVNGVQALGLDAGLDFHGRVHKPMAKQLIRLLEPSRPLFIEEPLLSENIEGIRQIAGLTSLPIALGERLTRAGTSNLSSRPAPSTSSSRISAMREGFPRCGALPPWPRPMTSRWRPIVRWARLPWPPACRSAYRRRTTSSRKCRSASTTTPAATTC